MLIQRKTNSAHPKKDYLRNATAPEKMCRTAWLLSVTATMAATVTAKTTPVARTGSHKKMSFDKGPMTCGQKVGAAT
jgi:hypothetical protein